MLIDNIVIGEIWNLESGIESGVQTVQKLKLPDITPPLRLARGGKKWGAVRRDGGRNTIPDF